MYIERTSKGERKMADIKKIDAMWDDSPIDVSEIGRAHV